MRKSKKIILALLVIILALGSFFTTKYFLEQKNREEHKEKNKVETEQEEDSITESVKEKRTEKENKSAAEDEREDKEESEEDKEPAEEETIAEVPLEKEEQIPVPDSGIRICIDPGHYEGANAFESNDGSYYCEGDVDLQIAQELQRILKEKYGISSDLTRDFGTININGYTNSVLDNGHISLRGEMSEGYDLFLSIHTNANVEGANGYPTYSQPVSINKPVLIANRIACEDENILAIGNYIGSNLQEINYKMGLSTVDTFKTVSGETNLLEWTNEYNDGMDVAGTICVRTGTLGDYYGVLRGAANVGVPGFIIEHGHHTVPEVREQIINGDLIMQWAKADARGIAEGFNLIP